MSEPRSAPSESENDTQRTVCFHVTADVVSWAIGSTTMTSKYYNDCYCLKTRIYLNLVGGKSENSLPINLEDSWGCLLLVAPGEWPSTHERINQSIRTTLWIRFKTWDMQRTRVRWVLIRTALLVHLHWLLHSDILLSFNCCTLIHMLLIVALFKYLLILYYFDPAWEDPEFKRFLQ